MNKIKRKSFLSSISLKNNWIDIAIVCILLFATIAINSRMIEGGLNGTGDVRWHLTWIQHFSKQLSEGIWYPRWLAGTNYGYGSPTFVFYPPLPYYIGSFFKLIGFNIEQSFTIVCSLAVFLCGFFFYLYGRSKFNKIPALFGALSYMLSPFIAIFLDGGVFANLVAYIWIPIGVYVTEKSMVNPKWKIFIALIWFLVALTHTPSLLVYFITWLFYVTFLVWIFPRQWKDIAQILLFGVAGIGCATFYLIPAILEQRFVNIQYMLASQSQFYMPSIPKLIKVGLSFVNDGIMNFQFVSIIVFALIGLIGFRKESRLFKLTFYTFSFAIIIIFFISDWSLLIWNLSLTLQKVESSWRLGGLLFFGQAILCSLAVKFLISFSPSVKDFDVKFYLTFMARVIGVAAIIILLFLNFKFGFIYTRAHPSLYTSGRGKMFIKPWIETIIHDPYSNRLVDVPEYRTKLDKGDPTLYQKESYTDTGLINHEPSSSITLKSPLPKPLINQPPVSIVQGKASYKIEKWDSYYRKILFTVQESSIVRLRTYYYPAWQLTVNTKPVPFDKAEDGTIEIKLPPGENTLLLTYGKTGDYKFAIAISYLSLIALSIFSVFLLKRRI